MANKCYTSHIKKILKRSTKYNTLPVYLTLVKLAKQYKDVSSNICYFYIPQENEHLNPLVNTIRKENPHITSRLGVYKALNELFKLDILVYESSISAWILKDMENMIKVKSHKVLDSDHTGYMMLRDIFFENDFYDLKWVEQKLLIFLCHKLDFSGSSKFSKTYGVDFFINLKKQLKQRNSLTVFSILRTKNIYYANSVIFRLLLKFSDYLLESTNDIYEKCKLNNDPRFVHIFNVSDKLKSRVISKKSINVDNLHMELASKFNNIYGQVLHAQNNFNIAFSKLEIIEIITELKNLNIKLRKWIINSISRKKLDTENPIKNFSKYIRKVTIDKCNSFSKIHYGEDTSKFSTIF